MAPRREQKIANVRKPPRRNSMWAAFLVAVAFLLAAFGGSIFVTHKLSQTADAHASSAGRSGDPSPNTTADQPSMPPKGGSSTTGANPTGSAPPARK
jgi:hypothetical protein